MVRTFKTGLHRFSFLFVSIFVASLSSSQAASLFIQVKDSSGNLLPGATIYAMSFGNQGPDAINSEILADGNDGDGSNGLIQLNLNSNIAYDIFADLQNYGPTVNNQMSNPTHPHVFLDALTDGTTHVIVLGSTFTDRGSIVAHATSPVHNGVIFGNVRKISTGNDIAFAACATDNNGFCDMVFHNIPVAASANIYDVSVFDPAANSGQGQGNGGQLNSAVALTPPNAPATISIDISNGLAPDLTANSGSHNQPNGEDASNSGLEGVIEDVNFSTMTIPYGGINFRVEENGAKFDRFGTGVDQNGRFKSFGLDIGTTYYVRAFGGCRMDNVCYDGFESTATNSGPLGLNDFVYVSSDPVQIKVGPSQTLASVLHVRLSRATPGAFSIPVYVRDSSGRLLPGSNVNLWPDGTPWHHSANPNAPYAGPAICDSQFHNVDISSPAFANLNVQASTGYALLGGLRPGNYTVGAWTQFGNNKQISFNGGADGRFEWNQGGNNHRGCFSSNGMGDEWTSEDDLRLSVEANGAINVYDTSGTIVMANVSSITIVSPLPQNLTGVVHGTLDFPDVVDLRSEPISIVLNTCDNTGCHGNFTTIDGFGQSSYPYSIQVASSDAEGEPLTYFQQVISQYWGVVKEGDGQHQIIFVGTDTITQNFKFARAGRVAGKLYKPDGSLLQPGNQAGGGYINANINAQGVTNHSWGDAQVNQDGSFVIGGLLPGEYKLIPRTYGSNVAYSAPEPAERVIVTVLADQYKDVQFQDGELVHVIMDTNTLSVSLPTQYQDHDETIGERWEAKRVPAGSVFNHDLLLKILDHNGDDPSRFSIVPKGQSTRCGGNWGGGFCPQSVPTDSTYDFYMFRSADIGGQMESNDYSFFTIVGSSKNVIVDANHKTPASLVVNHSTITSLIQIEFDPVGLSSGVVVTGQVIANHFLRKVDFDALGGSFDNFIKFIPTIALYDDKGQLVSAGLVTPTPQYIALHNDEFDTKVANGDFDVFKALLDGSSWFFKLNGVPPGKTYTLIGTTPNYPPFIKTITTGVDNSTTTVLIDWDSEVGVGATVKGVVKSTGGVAIEGASVEIQAKAIKTKTLTTDSSGHYLTEGLPVGTYKIQASASGFASAAQELEVVAASTSTVDFTTASGFPLVAAAGVITGTVREISFTRQGPVVRPVSGARVFAYDDTFNGDNPDKPLTLYKVITSSAGVYSLTSLIPGDVYKISVSAPGRYVESDSTQAIAGTLSGIDFMLKKKGLEVQVFARPNSPNYEFSILNPNNFESGQVWYEDAAGGFNKNTATEISDTFHDLPDGSLIGEIPMSQLDPEKSYILHIEAVPANGASLVTKEITFSLDTNGSTDQPVDDKLIGDDTEDESGHKNNEVTMDSSGSNGASLEIPAGSLISTETTPTITMTQASTDSLPSGQRALVGALSTVPTFYGDVFNVNFNDVQFTSRPVVFNLPYNPQSVGGDLSNLEVLHEVNSVWVPLQGQITIDPVSSVVSIQVNGQTQLAGQAPINISSNMSSQSKNKTRSMAASFDGKQHHFSAQAASSGSGSFVVGLAASTGSVNASGNYKQYSFPNPFNLQQKTVTRVNSSGGTAPTSIRGTSIVVAPTGSGACTIKVLIYNVAGEMVRELIHSTALAGNYNSVDWDGKNTSGSDVASGVYFAVVDAPGSDKKEHIKMVVVK